jgi:hypothetical protein
VRLVVSAQRQTIEEITDILKIRTNPVRRFLQGTPLIGNLF